MTEVDHSLATSMKANSRGKARFTSTLLCLMAAQPVGVGNTVDFRHQDTERKIISDDFTKNRRDARSKSSTPTRSKARRTYRLASHPQVGAHPSWTGNNVAQLGITIWRLRLATPTDGGHGALLREKSQSLSWVAERVESDAVFREGDRVRISVESPRGGYLYVLDRDLSADGTTGEAMLIYPWSEVDNELTPGRLIDIPAQDDDPSYFSARITAAEQIGELLTFIVTSRRLDLPISNKPFEIKAVQIKNWEKAWGGVSERFEMEGGSGELWTQEEQQAAAKKGRRQLTRDDPGPQTIYRITRQNTKALLVNVRLRYQTVNRK